MTKRCMIIGDIKLKLEDLIAVTRGKERIEISKEAMKKIKKSRALVDEFVDKGEVIYGITTGFGRFSDKTISKAECALLQKNLIMSHACGVGNPIDKDHVRGIMLLRINNLIQGYSGVREEVIELLVEMLNRDVIPYIPEKGSLGASGDLAPLAHMVLVMLGMGEAYIEKELLPGDKALKKVGLTPLKNLSAKEGLALINGTQVMTSIGAHTLYDAINLMKTMDISASLTMEALRGIICAFDQKIQDVRGHKGQKNTAKNIRKILKGSSSITKQGELRVQDAYALRCIPQIHGASKDALNYVKEKVEIEMNAVTDNPIIFVDEHEVLSGGNFHGQPMALAFDFLGIAISEMANISERRIERLVNPALNNGLPAFLVKNGGINSGFMIVQYSAASLVSENKVLAHPASVDSIPSSANQEDHVSMGTIAARKARDILRNARKVVAMECLVACQGIDLREIKKLGKGTEVAYDIVREYVKYYDKDRVMYLDINDIERAIERAEILYKVEEKIGKIEC